MRLRVPTVYDKPEPPGSSGVPCRAIDVEVAEASFAEAPVAIRSPINHVASHFDEFRLWDGKLWSPWRPPVAYGDGWYERIQSREFEALRHSFSLEEHPLSSSRDDVGLHNKILDEYDRRTVEELDLMDLRTIAATRERAEDTLLIENTWWRRSGGPFLGLKFPEVNSWVWSRFADYERNGWSRSDVFAIDEFEAFRDRVRLHAFRREGEAGERRALDYLARVEEAFAKVEVLIPTAPLEFDGAAASLEGDVWRVARELGARRIRHTSEASVMAATDLFAALRERHPLYDLALDGVGQRLIWRHDRDAWRFPDQRPLLPVLQRILADIELIDIRPQVAHSLGLTLARRIEFGRAPAEDLVALEAAVI